MSRLLFLAVLIGLVIAAIYVVPGMTNWNAELDKYLQRNNANKAAQEAATGGNVQRAAKPDAIDIIDHRDNLIVDFQGLRLGLPLKELPAFVNQKKWKFALDAFQDSINTNKPSQAILIDSVGDIGAEADKSFHYGVYGLLASFYNGQLAELTVGGPEYPELIRAQRWIGFAVAGISKKYGEPQQVIIPIENLTATNFQPGVVTHFLRWKVGSRMIILGGTGGRGRYQPQVIYTDLRLKEQMEKAAKSESNM